MSYVSIHRRGQTYQLIRGLLAPKELGDVKYDDIIRTMTNHYNPKTSAIVERFKFNKKEA